MNRPSRRLLAHFGGLLRPLSPAELGTLWLPAGAREFLAQVGLPAAAPVVTLGPGPRGFPVLRVDGARCLLIGEDAGGNHLAIREVDGEVLCADPDGRRPTCFVNSDVVRFLECLRGFALELPARNRVRRISRTPEGRPVLDLVEVGEPVDDDRRAARLRRRLRATDPPALGPGTWWSDVVEDVGMSGL